MEGGFLLDVVVSKGASILKLLASKYQPLLVWGDALLVLDLGFLFDDAATTQIYPVALHYAVPL